MSTTGSSDCNEGTVNGRSKNPRRRQRGLSDSLRGALNVSDIRVRSPLRRGCLGAAAVAASSSSRRGHVSRLLLFYQRLRRQYFPRVVAAEAAAKQQQKRAQQQQQKQRQLLLLHQQQEQLIPFHERAPPRVCAAAALLLHQQQLQDATAGTSLRLPRQDAIPPAAAEAAVSPTQDSTTAAAKRRAALALPGGAAAAFPETAEQAGRAEAAAVVLKRRSEAPTASEGLQKRQYPAAPAVTAAATGGGAAAALLQQKKNVLHKRLWRLLRRKSSSSAAAFHHIIEELEATRLPPDEVTYTLRLYGELLCAEKNSAFDETRVWNILQQMREAKVHPSLVRYNYRVLLSYVELRGLAAEPRRENVLRLLRAAWLLAALVRNRRQRYILRRNSFLRQLGMPEHQLLSLHDLTALWVGTAVDPLLPKPAQAVLLQERFSSSSSPDDSSEGVSSSLFPHSPALPLSSSVECPLSSSFLLKSRLSFSSDAEAAALAAAAADPRAPALPEAYSAAAAAAADTLEQHPLFAAHPEGGKGLTAEFSPLGSCFRSETESELTSLTHGPPVETLLFDDRLTAVAGTEAGARGGRKKEKNGDTEALEKKATETEHDAVIAAEHTAIAGEIAAEAVEREKDAQWRRQHVLEWQDSNGQTLRELEYKRRETENSEAEKTSQTESVLHVGGKPVILGMEGKIKDLTAGRKKRCDTSVTSLGRPKRRTEYAAQSGDVPGILQHTSTVADESMFENLAPGLRTAESDICDGDLPGEPKIVLQSSYSFHEDQAASQEKRIVLIPSAATCESSNSLDKKELPFSACASNHKEPTLHRSSSPIHKEIATIHQQATSASLRRGHSARFGSASTFRRAALQKRVRAARIREKALFEQTEFSFSKGEGASGTENRQAAKPEVSVKRATRGGASLRDIWRVLHGKAQGESKAHSRHRDGVPLLSQQEATTTAARLAGVAAARLVRPTSLPSTVNGEEVEIARDTMRKATAPIHKEAAATAQGEATPSARGTVAAPRRNRTSTCWQAEQKRRMGDRSDDATSDTRCRTEDIKGERKRCENTMKTHADNVPGTHSVEPHLFFRKGRARVMNWRK